MIRCLYVAFINEVAKLPTLIEIRISQNVMQCLVKAQLFKSLVASHQLWFLILVCFFGLIIPFKCFSRTACKVSKYLLQQISFL